MRKGEIGIETAVPTMTKSNVLSATSVILASCCFISVSVGMGSRHCEGVLCRNLTRSDGSKCGR